MKAFNEMTYDELMKIRKNNNIKTAAFTGASAILMILLKNPLFLFSIHYALHSNKTENGNLSKEIAKKDEDIKTINTICNEIIDNIVRLAKEFNVDNPIDAFYLFCLMYEYGCFSYDLNNFHKLKMSVYKDENLMGSLTLNGHGVCRHEAVFLQKLYTKLGYESDVACGYCQKINPLTLNDFSKDYQFMKDASKQEIDEFFLKKYTDVKIKHHSPKFSEKGYVNHALTRVDFNNYIILTDPVNSSIFCKIAADIYSSLLLPLCTFVLDEKRTEIFNDLIEIKTIEEKPELDSDRILSQIFESGIKFLNKEDVFHSFHKNNLNMLEEAENLTQKVLVKKY